MDYTFSFTINKTDADRLLPIMGYSPDIPLSSIQDRIKSVLAVAVSNSDKNLDLPVAWFKSVCDVSRISDVVRLQDGSCEFQFSLLPDRLFPDLPSHILDALVETPSEYRVSFPLMSLPHAPVQ